MARRENSQTRRGRERVRRPEPVLVICGGEKTEFDYFSGLRLVRGVRIKPKCKVDSPANLVKYAKKLIDQYPDEFGAVWCVVDVDNFDIDAAIKQADSLGVQLAVSNPCFELWLLLHFADCRAHIKDGKAACALLAKHVPGYDKKLDYAVFDAGLEAAVGGAKALEPGNPSTGVWRLVEVILTR